MVQAAKHCTQDVGIWQWASRPSPGTPPIFLPFPRKSLKTPARFCVELLLHFIQQCVTILLAELHNIISPDEPLRIACETEGGGISGESHSVECRRCKVLGRPKPNLSGKRTEQTAVSMTVSVRLTSEPLIFFSRLFYFSKWRHIPWKRCCTLCKPSIFTYLTTSW